MAINNTLRKKGQIINHRMIWKMQSNINTEETDQVSLKV